MSSGGGVEGISVINKGKGSEVARGEKVKSYFESEPNDSASDRKMRA